MKKLFILLLVAGTFFSSEAQIKTPSASPSAKIMQTVGLTDVEVTYSRPSVKGRTIFGDNGLVPNGEVWRTGANSATKITFSEDVRIEGKDLKAGSYAILTLPADDMWQVHFHNYESSSWSSYKEKTAGLIVKVAPNKTTSMTESFTISIDNVTDNGAAIHIKWADLSLPLKLSVHTDKQAMASIDKLLAGPSKNDYYNIGSYYHSSGKDLKKALEYITKATEGPDRKFWQVRKRALILADLGKTADAIEEAKTSMELAKKAGNKDYVRMNEASIAEWSK